MKITCPNCGTKGSVPRPHVAGLGERSDAFEAQGTWEGKPLRKCLRCGAGMTVGFGKRITLIEPGLWEEMQRTWAIAFGGDEDDYDEMRKVSYERLLSANCPDFIAKTIAHALIPLASERPMSPELKVGITSAQQRFATEYAEPMFDGVTRPPFELVIAAQAALATYRDLALTYGDAWYAERYQGALERSDPLG